MKHIIPGPMLEARSHLPKSSTTAAHLTTPPTPAGLADVCLVAGHFTAVDADVKKYDALRLTVCG